MWNPFAKKKKSSEDGFPLRILKTDIHSHLIPGIDDGSDSLESSLEMVRKLVGLGYERLITTPHIMSDGYPNGPDNILKGLEKLRQAIKEEGISVEIEAAAEYYLDEIFEGQIETEELLTFGGEKKYLLFETSYMSRPLSLETVIFKLKTQGYQPVFAHPERYRFFWEEKGADQIEEIRDLGVLLQVNIGSLAGTYSRRAGALAKKLLQRDLVDFLGTDLHRQQQIPSLLKALDQSKELRQLLDSDRLLNAGL